MVYSLVAVMAKRNKVLWIIASPVSVDVMDFYHLIATTNRARWPFQVKGYVSVCTSSIYPLMIVFFPLVPA